MARPMLGVVMATTMALAPVLARAAEPPCLTTAEFAALAGYALPSTINGAAQRCAAALPADAFLRSEAAALAARYGQAKPAAWPGAKGAFLKLSSGANSDAARLLTLLPDDVLKPLVDAAVQAKVAEAMPPERCGVADRVLRLLAPLPPENTAELIALAVGLGAGSGGAPAPLVKAGRLGKITLCPMEPSHAR